MDIEITPGWFLPLDPEYKRSLAQDGWTNYTDGRRNLAVCCYELSKDSKGNIISGSKGDLQGFLAQTEETSRFILQADGVVLGAGIPIVVPGGMYLDTQTICGSEVVSIAFSSQLHSDVPWAIDLWANLYNSEAQELFVSAEVKKPDY